MFGYDSPRMLSRAQEARIRALIWGSSPGTLLTYCLEHLANSAKIPASHMSDLAVFVRSLHERGDCQRRFGGFCEAGRHETAGNTAITEIEGRRFEAQECVVALGIGGDQHGRR